jgi:hypothetical protein
MYAEMSPLRETENSDWHILFVCQENADCWEMTGLSQVIQDRFGTAGEVLLDVCALEAEDVVSKILSLI